MKKSLLILIFVISINIINVFGAANTFWFHTSTSDIYMNSSILSGTKINWSDILNPSPGGVNADTCSAGNYSYYNGSAFKCSPDTTGTGSSDGNNYTTSISINGTNRTYQLNVARNGMTNLSTNLLINGFTIDCNNVTGGSDGNHCDDATGSGTVTQINSGVYTTGGVITTTGTIDLNLTALINNIGNWSFDKPNYVNQSYANATYLLLSYNNTLARTGTCGVGQVVQNTTNTGVQCVTPAGSTYTAGDGLILTGTQFNVSANTCSAGNYSYYNGTGFQCSPDTTGAGSSDGNNYTSSLSNNATNNLIQFNLARIGMINLTTILDLTNWNDTNAINTQSSRIDALNITKLQNNTNINVTGIILTNNTLGTCIDGELKYIRNYSGDGKSYGFWCMYNSTNNLQWTQIIISE